MVDNVRAYLLIEASAGEGNNVLETVRAMPATVQADRVTGPYDVVAVLESSDLDQLGSIIHDEVQAVPGITRTMSCLRFEA
ncbi:MAG: Lrp/AsnC ligand binding domain-containing protein [Chloroflexi bacterium]|nr:Lrp/AsnC ligand binding domain-containing protein [Chloroflexota bacterium]MBT4074857.1 Lrp/AsnC ligand binding domain-containing protein [Chloroflexota bacterium]MBT4513884.1 Lrp/AsnC ligand binding domain-containing protein [Chloroflexota bacterium]MBT6680490.1 Lrp/AsnC ligand binding domain-containing protein [Chloroflexota bacterium]